MILLSQLQLNALLLSELRVVQLPLGTLELLLGGLPERNFCRALIRLVQTLLIVD